MARMVRTSWLLLVATIAIAVTSAGCEGGKAKFIDAGPDDVADASGVVIIDAGIDAPAGHAGTGTVSGAGSPQYQRRGGVAGATQP
jgi:hypothetical protein